MIAESNIKLIIALKDPDLEPEELEERTRNLVREMEDVGVEHAALVAVEEIPEGAKAFGGFLLGLLQAEVSVANIKRVLGFVSNRLGSQPIELEVEANGKKLKVKASSQQELQAAIEAAQQFVAAG